MSITQWRYYVPLACVLDLKLMQLSVSSFLAKIGLFWHKKTPWLTNKDRLARWSGQAKLFIFNFYFLNSNTGTNTQNKIPLTSKFGILAVKSHHLTTSYGQHMCFYYWLANWNTQLLSDVHWCINGSDILLIKNCSLTYFCMAVTSILRKVQKSRKIFLLKCFT